MTTIEDINNDSTSPRAADELAARLSNVVLNEKACPKEGTDQPNGTNSPCNDIDERLSSAHINEDDRVENGNCIEDSKACTHNDDMKPSMTSPPDEHHNSPMSNGFINGSNLSPETTAISNGHLHEQLGYELNSTIKNSPDTIDVSCASYFTAASPGSESMVTASEGALSRSQSSLSCPSAGSSNSSIVSTSRMSPERDCIESSENSPSPSAVTDVTSFYLNQEPTQGKDNYKYDKTITSDMSGNDSSSIEKDNEACSYDAPKDSGLYSLASSGNTSETGTSSNIQHATIPSAPQEFLPTPSVTIFHCCNCPKGNDVEECEHIKVVRSEWKELSTVIRQLHHTVVNSTVVEAGGSRIESPAPSNAKEPATTESSATQRSDSTNDSHQTSTAQEETSNDNSSCSNDSSKQDTLENSSSSKNDDEAKEATNYNSDQSSSEVHGGGLPAKTSGTTQQQPRTHTVKISSPVFQKVSIERIASLIHYFLEHDPCVLLLKLCHLMQELCELLKARLVGIIKESPTLEETHAYAKSVCQSYQQVVCVVEAELPALKAIEAKFNISWMSFAVHVFNHVVLTDKDIMPYINLCKKIVVTSSDSYNTVKIGGSEDSSDSSGLVWWSWLARVCKVSSLAAKEGHANRVAHFIKSCTVTNPLPNLPAVRQSPELAEDLSGNSKNGDGPACECNHCYNPATMLTAPSPQTQAAVPDGIVSGIPSTGLYPHIHGETVPLSSAPSIIKSSQGYAQGDSSVMSESFMREWQANYGDTLAPPGGNHGGTHCDGSCQCAVLQNAHSGHAGISDAGCASSTATGGSDGCVGNSLRQEDLKNDIKKGATSSSQPSSTCTDECCSTHRHKRALRRQARAAEATEGGAMDTAGESAEEWTSSGASGDESDVSSSGHVDNHCDCCYCHRSHYRHSGGRQKYSDRRDRLLRILNQKKSAQVSSSSTPTTMNSTCTTVAVNDIDSIVSYIEGSSHDNKINKKSSKKHKQRVRKMAVERKQQIHAAAAAAANEDPSDSETPTSYSRTPPVNSKSRPNSTPASSSASTAAVPEPSNVLPSQFVGQKQQLSSTGSSSPSSVAANTRARQPQGMTYTSSGAVKRRDISDDSASSSYSSGQEYNQHNNSSTTIDDLLDRDGTIAQLRKRAPEVTVTLVKQEDQQLKQQQQQMMQPQQRGRSTLTKSQELEQQQQMRFGGSSQHPLTAAPMPHPSLHANNSPQSYVPYGAQAAASFAAAPRMPGAYHHPSSVAAPPMPNKAPHAGGALGGGGLSKLIEGLEKDDPQRGEGKDSSSSQMVTIRRVMDPVSAEPTVTITLKGEEAAQEKVLYKLVNGQAIPGDAALKGRGAATVPQQPPRNNYDQQQLQPIPPPPPHLTPQEAKKWKKQQKKERQKLMKIEEDRKLQRQQELQKRQYEQQSAILKQQEEQLRLQTLQIQRQQEELMRLQQQQAATLHIGTQNNTVGKKKGGIIDNNKAKQQQQPKGKQNNKNKKGKKNKNSRGSSNSDTEAYDGTPDDVTKGLQLPPGVSITRVAGQPGMLTISNNPPSGHMAPHHPMIRPQMSAMNQMVGGMGNPAAMVAGGIPHSMYGMTPIPAMGAVPPNMAQPMNPGLYHSPDMMMAQGAGHIINNPGWTTPSTIAAQPAVMIDNKKPDKPATDNNKKNRRKELVNNQKNNKQNQSPIAGKNNKQGKGKKNQPEPVPVLDKRMTEAERIQAALDGLLDPDRLSTKQRNKYNKLLAERGPSNDTIAAVPATQLNNQAAGNKKKTDKSQPGNNTKTSRDKRSNSSGHNRASGTDAKQSMVCSDASGSDDDEPLTDEENLMDQLYNLKLGKVTATNLSVAGMAISCSKEEKEGSGESRDTSRGATRTSTTTAPTVNAASVPADLKKSSSGVSLQKQVSTDSSTAGGNKKQQQSSKKQQNTKSGGKNALDTKASDNSKKTNTANTDTSNKNDNKKKDNKNASTSGGNKNQQQKINENKQTEKKNSRQNSESDKNASGAKNQPKKAAVDNSNNTKVLAGGNKQTETKVQQNKQQGVSQQPQKQSSAQPPQKQQTQQQSQKQGQQQNNKQAHQQKQNQQQQKQSQQQHQQVQRQNSNGGAPALTIQQKLQQLSKDTNALLNQQHHNHHILPSSVPAQQPTPECTPAQLALQQPSVQQQQTQQHFQQMQQFQRQQQELQQSYQQQQQQQVVTTRQQQPVTPSLQQSVFSDTSSPLGSYNPLMGSQFPGPFGVFNNTSSTGFGFSNNSGVFGGNTSAFNSGGSAFGSIGSGFNSGAPSYLGSGSTFGSSNSTFSATPSTSYGLQSGFSGSNRGVGSLGSGTGSVAGGFNSNTPIGFSSSVGDSHDVRYAQYMQANGPLRDNRTQFTPGALGGLSLMSSTSIGGGSMMSSSISGTGGANLGLPFGVDDSRNYQPNPNVGVIGKKPRKSRKTNEEMSIDNVFRPNNAMGGDADDKDIEEFKAFCMYNSSAHGGADKPKLNFDMKDLMMNKKANKDL